MVSLHFLPTALALSAAAPLLFTADAASLEKENQVKMILQRMESEVLAFRDHMEDLADSRCEAATLAACSQSNYNDCSSTYPNQICMAADELVIPACGNGDGCNALWSPDETCVRIPANLALGPSGNPTDPQVIESVCYSRLAEPYMLETYKPGNQMYFGSASGSFRIIPARHSEVCGAYDPRRRPWFVAASSGPKDVVLVIDISGSMNDYYRMDMAKEAAVTIVETLTVADRIAIVAFSGSARLIGGQNSLIRATSENKKTLIEAINGLEAGGSTNFYDAFEKTFNALELTIRNETTAGCNIAVLFMTDGQSTAGPGESEAIDLVNQRVDNIAKNYNQKTTIFTYSLGDKADHFVTKRIACSTNGIWTAVDDFTDDLVSAMSSYYRLYSLGLGEGGNSDWVAWVEPYPFHTAGKIGTSASTPVYDRSIEPPQFLGVATVDMWLDDLADILGEDAASSKMLDRFVKLSTARCPAIELTDCEIESLRFAGGGSEATCGTCNSTEYTGILPHQCLDEKDLPSSLWENTDMLGMEYEERACCETGGTLPSDMCPREDEEPSSQPSSQPSRRPSSWPSTRPSSELYIWSDPDQSGTSYNTGLIIGVCVANLVVLALLTYLLRKTWPAKNTDAEIGLPTRGDTDIIGDGDSLQLQWPSKPEAGIEMAVSGKMVRLDSVDPPANQVPVLPAHIDTMRRQISIDPPADKPVQSHHNNSQSVAPVAASASPLFNSDYARIDSSFSDLDLEARQNNLRTTLPQSPATTVEESGSVEPTENDVLFDRGNGVVNSNHPGNIKFRRKADELRSWYEHTTSKEEKKNICDLLVESVTCEGRLVERGENGLWYEVTANGARRKKASQALKRKSSRTIT